MPRTALDALCDATGIERLYVDQFGERREVDEVTIRALATALRPDLVALDPERHRAGRTPIVPVTIVYAGAGAHSVPITLPKAANQASVSWEIVAEGGAVHAGRTQFHTLQFGDTVAVDGQLLEQRCLPLPSLDPGYHRLRVRLGEESEGTDAGLIVAPTRAYLPPVLEAGPGIWGIAVQLYALRSPKDWGIGDFGVLSAFLKMASAAGAGVVGINPLHALYLDEPERASPYSPSSRLYLNPLYIDVPGVPDFAESQEASSLFASADFQTDLVKLHSADLVDYEGVATLKRRMLELLYGSFRGRHLGSRSARAEMFTKFVTAEGEPLRRFCLFQALREEFSRHDLAMRYWRNWAPAYRDPASPDVAAFAAHRAPRVEFFAYLQWIAHRQLADCAAVATDAGMPVGLYRDLAVGVDAGAADAWGAQRIVVEGWSIGAPPDIWNRKGQNWGLSPVNPVALRQEQYRSFIALIRANMRHAGALRIDHVLGLWRTFWICNGKTPARGAYVRNPFTDLATIIALESHRARCVVVGEDLGTIPDGLRAALQEAGILSYRLLYFERNPDGTCCPPEAYPHQALVSIGTHDLPTLNAYWRGIDLTLHAERAPFADAAELHAEKERRTAEVARLADALRGAGLIGAEVPDEAPALEAYCFLARTKSRIVMVQIEDVLGIADQINVPGTIDEHPNWRRRLPLDVDALFRDGRFQALCEMLVRERPSQARPDT